MTPSQNALSVQSGETVNKVDAVPAYMYQDNNYFMLRDIGRNVGYQVDWDEEVKENFSAPYSEVYRSDDNVLSCINVSDVQYDVNNIDQWEKYLELWDLREEICQSLYFIES